MEKKIVRHIIQITNDDGEWGDYAPGSVARLDLESTISIAKALKPDRRRMRVVTLTETASTEVE